MRTLEEKRTRNMCIHIHKYVYVPLPVAAPLSQCTPECVAARQQHRCFQVSKHRCLKAYSFFEFFRALGDSRGGLGMPLGALGRGIHCLRFVVGFLETQRLFRFVFFVAFSSTLGSILVAFGLLFGTFLSTLGVPGRSRGAFGHPWAPKAQKVRKRSQKAAKPQSLFEHFLVVFA